MTTAHNLTTFTFPSRIVDGLNISAAPGHPVRVVEIDGNPWFAAVDVCRVLDMDTEKGAYRWLTGISQDEKRLVTRDDTPNLFVGVRASALALISEPGLYRLITRSDKPAARPFQDWVTREVLPAIRKTGTFTMEKGETMPLPADIATAWQEVHKAKLAEAQAKLAEAEAYGAVVREEAEKLAAQAEAERQRKLAAEAAAQAERLGAEVETMRPKAALADAVLPKNQALRLTQFVRRFDGVNIMKVKRDLDTTVAC